MIEALAGLLQGMSGGMDTITQNRQKQKQLMMQEQEQKRLQRQQELTELTTLLDETAPNSAVDPQLAQRAAGFGLGHRFGKNDMGMPILLESPKQKLDRIRLQDAETDAKVSALQLSESEASKAFRERISTEEGIQWAMSQPLAKRQMLFARHGMNAPMNNDELAQKELAESTGRLKEIALQGQNQLAVQAKQNEGYLATANARTNTQESFTAFNQWVNQQYSADPAFRMEYDAAKAEGKLDAFTQFALQKYKEMGFK
jgi:hypothetical protein